MVGTIWSGERAVDAGELQRRARQAASGFESLGVRSGDGVAIYLRNDYPFFETSLGAGMLGAYPVAMNWHYTPAEARYLLEDSQARVLVIHADLLAAVKDIVPPGVHVLVAPVPREIQTAYGLSDTQCAVPEQAVNWDTWRAQFDARERPPSPMPSTIIYTSGTTGRPKGVRRPAATPEQTAVSTRMLAQSYGLTEYLDRGHEVTTAVVGPIYHSAPNAHANFCFRHGANVVMMPRFDPEALLELIQTHRVTHLNMVPIMFNRLLKLPEQIRSAYDVSSLRFVAHAAAPVSPPIKRAMIEWWGPVINEYYGSTETSATNFHTSEEALRRAGTVGRTIPGAVVKIFDDEGKELAPNEIGTIYGRIIGSADFTYHGRRAERDEIEREGLITSGDMGYIDEDGYLFLCDRKKDMVISGGVNIYPAEIEAVLHQMPGVHDCAVFGIPDEEFGESLAAYIEPDPGTDLTPENVQAYCRKHMAGYKVPKVVKFARNLPREDSGKIFKRKLREPYWAEAGRRI